MTSRDPRVEMYKKYIDENNDLPCVWLAVGTNKGASSPTWFYTFYRSKDAVEFVERAEKIVADVEWDAFYPCEIDDVDSALDAFQYSYNEP